jgi:uncharacterized protein (TIGR03086 family)
MDLSELHQRAVSNWQARVEAIEPHQWSNPTPCADWDVRTLVNHVVAEELWTPSLVGGATIEQVGHRFDGDVLGEDPATTARTAALLAVAAVDAEFPAEPLVHLSFGDVPLGEYVHQLTADHLIHAWDLAAGTGQPRELDSELVTGVAAWFAEREQMYREAGAVGVRVEAADDPQSQLLAGFGRNPSW